MTNKNLILAHFLAAFLFCASAMADEPRSALDSKPSVDSTAFPVFKPPTRISPQATVEAPAEPSPIQDERVSYVYDLKKLIIKSKENIKNVNDKIKEQAVVKRNQKREERTREYYERGKQLSDEGKLGEAREYFEKAIRLTEHPEMSGYIRQNESRLKTQEVALKREQQQLLRQQEAEQHVRQSEAKQIYIDAVRLYKEKKFKEAKDAFERVDELSADYKATRSYLRIVDQDIIAAEALLLKQQKIEIGHQQKEAEVARLHEKEQWKKEVERKENERREQVNKQAQNVYEDAVVLYKEKKFQESKKKFQEVEWVIPDYKATRNYLNRVDNDIADEEKRIAVEKEKALAQQRWEEEVARRKLEDEQKRIADAKEKERRKQLEEEASFVYQAAMSLYDKKLYDEALEKLGDVEKTAPGYKSTRVYIAKINQIKTDIKRREEEQTRIQAENERRRKDEELRRQRDIEIKQQNALALQQKQEALKKEEIARKEEALRKEKAFKEFQAIKKEAISAKEVAVSKDSLDQNENVGDKENLSKVESSAKAQSTAQILSTYAEIQAKEAEQIVALARRSSQLYARIAKIADSSIAPAKKKMAEVEQVFSKLKTQKEDLLRQMREEQERARQAQIKHEQELALMRVEQTYDEAIMLLRNRKFDESKIKFNAIERTLPNFKSTRQYLSRIDKDKRQAEIDAVVERTRAEEKRLRDLQEKKRAEEEAQRAAEEERRRRLKETQVIEVKSLAEKAAVINNDILALSKQRNFDAANKKFEELEAVLEDLQKIKSNMANQEEHEAESSRYSKEANKIKEATRKINAKEVIRESARRKEVIKLQNEDRSPERKRQLIQEAERKKFLEGEKKRWGNARTDSSAKQEKADLKAPETVSVDLSKMTEAERQERVDYSNKRKELLAKQQVDEDREKEKNRIRRLADLQKQKEIERKEMQKRLTKSADEMYLQAMNMFKAGNFMAAKHKFQDIEDVLPGYKKTRDYIQKSQKEFIKLKNAPPRLPAKPKLMSKEEAIQKSLDRLTPNAK